MSNDTMGKTITVAVLLCLVCSVVVSTAAVSLRDVQIENKTLDMKKNILAAAQLLDETTSIQAQFSQIETRLVNVAEGRFAEQAELEADGISDISLYDQRKASKDKLLGQSVPSDVDIAGLKRRAKYSTVYMVRAENGDLERIILPVSGYGLWSTLYGFLALESDLNTVVGIGFYEHAETPGLGGEVDNPNWKSQWSGKKIYADNREVAMQLTKGKVDSSRPEAVHRVDGLSGATITSRGVTNLVQYWMGEQAYGPFLRKLKQEGV